MCYLELVHKPKYQTWCELDVPCARFGIYGRYQILWTHKDNFWLCYLELVYKLKYQTRCELDVPCARFGLYGRYQILWINDDNFW